MALQQGREGPVPQNQVFGKNQSVMETCIVFTQGEVVTEEAEWDVNKVTQRYVLLRENRQDCENG